MGSGVAVVVFIYLTVRPASLWVVSRMEEKTLDDSYVVGILIGVMALGVLADAVGIHAVFGAFTAGVVIPSGPLVALLTEKLEDYVTSFMMPLFYAVIGQRFDTKTLDEPGMYGFLIGVIFFAAACKVATIVVIAMFYGMPIREGISLGVLLNTKGIMELIVLHIALDKKVLHTQSYTAMILTSVILTAAVTPAAMLAHRPSRKLVSYKRRTIQRSKPDSELRMIACVHGARNVPSLVALLDLSHPSKRSPLFVYSLHLVELTGRESAMLIVHDTPAARRNPSALLGRVHAQSDLIAQSLHSYELHAAAVAVQPLTVVSPFSTMHEDVCAHAEDKHAALIVLPFHKQHTVDGGMELVNPGIRTLNRNVLANAPCSVAILVDRGLAAAARRVAVLFLGGPDDREALAYATRMADRSGTALTVLRFLDAACDGSADRALDDECVREFRARTVGNESVEYVEKEVGNGEELVEAVRGIDGEHDLYVVGRGAGVQSLLTAGLTAWAESPELGAIGDLLASSDFAGSMSVLVVQQYTGAVAMPANVDRMSVSETPSPEILKGNWNGHVGAGGWGP